MANGQQGEPPVAWSALLSGGQLIQGRDSSVSPGGLPACEVEAFGMELPGRRTYLVLPDPGRGEEFAFHWDVEMAGRADQFAGTMPKGSLEVPLQKRRYWVPGIRRNGQRTNLWIWPQGTIVALSNGTAEEVATRVHALEVACRQAG